MAVKMVGCYSAMMLLSLSYDHRMIDGKEALQFLVTILKTARNPARFVAWDLSV